MTNDTPSPDQEAATGRRRTWIPWVIAAVLLVGLVAALLIPRINGGEKTPAAHAEPATSRTAATMVVRGELTLGPGDFTVYAQTQGMTGETCAGTGGFSDIAEDAPVTVTDATGTVVGVGKVIGSRPAGYDGTRNTQCVLLFSVSKVPTGRGFYGVEVSHRGAIRYAEADLAKDVQQTLG
ncbi:hypothetical protein [Actinoplanes sp. N902-109]|uniref:hypothetical protein n=1 Tax=Actinoplanes sp. (strain N902-109) TaxID=649831 RepID=UPI0003294B52|nr:hypothetical protein [Actinoplanes sp. N902-109]AGL19474.1 hypothetical protein L083_5964 [Actinoplanes sp. N902-109]